MILTFSYLRSLSSHHLQISQMTEGNSQTTHNVLPEDVEGVVAVVGGEDADLRATHRSSSVTFTELTLIIGPTSVLRKRKPLKEWRPRRKLS